MNALVNALLSELDDQALALLAAKLQPYLATPSAESGFIGVQAASEYLSCPTSRIYALVSVARISHHRDGTRLLFVPRELDAWVRDDGGARRP